MAKILLLATNRDMYEHGLRVRESLAQPDDFSVFLGSMDEAFEFIDSVDLGEIDVILSRGATANMLEASNLGIPLVNIPISDVEVMTALNVARTLVDKEPLQIAYIGFTVTYNQIRAYLEAMGMSIAHYEIANNREIRETLGRIKGRVDVIVSGMATCTVAKEFGIPAVEIGCERKSLEQAVKRALEMQAAMHNERKNAEEQHVIINAVRDGIVSIDARYDIVMCNSQAAQIFGRNDISGRNIFAVCPSLPRTFVEEVLESGIPQSGYLLEIGRQKYAVSLTPITIKKRVTNAIFFLQSVEALQENEATVRKRLYLKGNVAQYRFEDIKGVSPVMRKTLDTARAFADIQANVLIIGETGTGKELFAQSIHNASHRRNGPFVAVNCGAIPTHLMESELFGYIEGAFTGARKGGKPGLFELAHGGTIFLDEIAELDPFCQVILLRALQEKQIRRVGGEAVIPVDVRVVAACNKNLHELVLAGRFRRDLYYRLNVLMLGVPPLRMRAGDVAHLAEHYLDRFNAAFGKKVRFTPGAIAALEEFSWDGNVRQLVNFCERITAIASDGELDAECVRLELAGSYAYPGLESGPAVPIGREEAYLVLGGKPLAKSHVIDLLEKCGGNRSAAARELGVGRTSFWRALRKLGMQ